jgi:hypothetical protein
MTKKPTDPELKKLYEEISKVIKIIHQSNYILTNSQKNHVLEQYALMLELSPASLKSLYGRRPESLEIQHVVDKLPNVYTVTDKADGDRYQLVICDNIVYLVSDNLRVKYTGITLGPKMTQYNNTILDGEYIFIAKEQRHIYMVFDCLVKGGENIREMPLLIDRLGQVDDLVDEVFTTKEQKGAKFEAYDMQDFKFDTNKILAFHEKQITNFMANLNADIKTDKKKVLVRRKYFIFPFGKNDNEIFQYSVLIWNMMVVNNRIHCPYKLDGLIYTPSEQKYIASVKESK